MSPKGKDWDKALIHWKKLFTDSDAIFDKEVNINTKKIKKFQSEC